jgi:site-specific DNA-cytosine methylase
LFRADHTAGAPHRRQRFFLLAHADGTGREGTEPEGRRDLPTWSRQAVADADSQQLREQPGRSGGAGGAAGSAFPPGPDDSDGWAAYQGPEPGVCRGAYGPARWVEQPNAVRFRTDRLRALGNAAVPQAVAAAYHILNERFN